ncbi:hypothetical protein [Bosea vaviloviae]|uniref:hypothetical protein n=1 Tax=Bosea vaviloviae TaxID=1526658 RepID=UPI0012E29230|nr:hypothetical protein [Bosea vaviloviae]
MLKTVCQVSSGLRKELGEKYYNLENIVYAVEAYSPIDEVYYVGYNVPAKNPIYGQFFKFVQTPNSYASAKTVVEIRYALHLDTQWRRFIVCKEMCHALDADEGTHSATDRSIEAIVSGFSLMSARQEFLDNPLKAMTAEILAEIGAVELLCPLEVRSRIITEANGQYEKYCDEFGIPRQIASLAFNENIIASVRTMIT